MQAKPTTLTIQEIVDLRKHDMARPNPEYQRGVVWTRDQQMKLIDSVLRGYPLPMIYLHEITKTFAGKTQESYEIIDGQQRITALYYFVEGAFPLYKPDDKRAKFPKFVQDQPCPWGGKFIHELSEELKSQLLDTALAVTEIVTDDSNEVRDLFVRLQSGFPLNAQEKRDAYPGNFTDFILQLGGKPDIPRYPGHEFFRKVLKMKPGRDRGKTRQLAAQIAILFLSKRDKDVTIFPDINAQSIDDYYYTHLGFDSDADDCKRLRYILDKLNDLFGSWKGPKLLAHNAIHLVLLLDSLLDDYTPSWESNLVKAQEVFSQALAASAVKAKSGEPDEFWLRYGVWTRTNSDKGENIQRRNYFFSSCMKALLVDLTPKDPKRNFDHAERELVYWNAKKKCAVCGSEVMWSEVDIHHIKPHGEGGQTKLENAALVHRACHPKGEEAKKFAENYLVSQL